MSDPTPTPERIQIMEQVNKNNGVTIWYAGERYIAMPEAQVLAEWNKPKTASESRIMQLEEETRNLKAKMQAELPVLDELSHQNPQLRDQITQLEADLKLVLDGLDNLKGVCSKIGTPGAYDNIPTMARAADIITNMKIRSDLMDRKLNKLFDAIKHGDETHQAWLKKAIEDHFK